MGDKDDDLDEESKKVADLLVAGARIAGNDSSVNAARFMCGEAAAEYVERKLSPNAELSGVRKHVRRRPDRAGANLNDLL